jgi:FdhE protein
MTHADWVQKHTFLAPIARLVERVDAALAAIPCSAAALPSWDDYASDYGEGIPLLHSVGTAVDLVPAGVMTCALIGALAASAAEGGREQDKIVVQARALDTELAAGPDAAQRVVDSLLGDDTFRPASAGLLRFLGWSATRRWLQPVLVAFTHWRDQERWQRSQCPACGALPAMAQLVGVDPGRMRFLACGCCGTRWRYRRTMCPFCEADTNRVQVVAVDAESGLRVDFCETCRGYLKTYVGHGREDVLLADWTSLHLDVLAKDHDLKRMATSLFEL